MTKRDFIERREAMHKDESRGGIIWLILFFGIMIALPFLGNWLDRNHPPAWIKWVFMVAFLAFMSGNLGWMIWSMKQRTRKYNMVCPSCGKPLTGYTGQIAVATGNCGHCGCALFEQ